MGWVRIAHLLALGLWVGANAFFSFCVALPIIGRMRELATTPGNWLNLANERAGTRVAGEALDVVFARYFPWQVACGVVALATAVLWFAAPGWLHKLRVAVIALGLGLAAVNLLVLAPQVHAARLARYSSDEAVAKEADASFARWHRYSLAADLTTLVCAAAALALAAYLPTEAKN